MLCACDADQVVTLRDASKPWAWDDATRVYSITPVGKAVVRGCMALTASSTTATKRNATLQSLALFDNVHVWKLRPLGA